MIPRKARLSGFFTTIFTSHSRACKWGKCIQFRIAPWATWRAEDRRSGGGRSGKSLSKSGDKEFQELWASIDLLSWLLGCLVARLPGWSAVDNSEICYICFIIAPQTRQFWSRSGKWRGARMWMWLWLAKERSRSDLHHHHHRAPHTCAHIKKQVSQVFKSV